MLKIRLSLIQFFQILAVGFLIIVLFSPHVTLAVASEELSTASIHSKKPSYHSKKPSYILTQKDGVFTLQAFNADVTAILKDISDMTQIPINWGPDFNSSITLSMRDVPLKQLLDKLAKNRAIVYVKKNNNPTDNWEIKKVTIATTHSKETEPINSEIPPHPLPEKSRPQKTSTSNQQHFNFADSNGDSKIHSEKEPARFRQDEVAVQFDPSLSNSEIQQIVNQLGLSIKKQIPAIHYHILSIPPDKSIASIRRQLEKQKHSTSVEPNYLIPIQSIPDDPHFQKQWALRNIGQEGGTEDADIDAVEAWDLFEGHESVTIAVIDTGVDYTHEDLADNIWRNPGEIPDNGIDDDENGYIDDHIGWDFVDASGGGADEDFEKPDNDPMDQHGHGTHVAGIAGAVTGNGIGIAGMAGNCKLMPVRAGYKDSSGDGVLESAAAAQAIIYAVNNGAMVINLSWGDYQKSSLITDAISYAADNGSLIIAAAGNGNSNNRIYPAAADNNMVLAVGATDRSDRKATFSNYGEWVDVSAPGVEIYSTHLNSGYRQRSGTSMATPHVSGLAALLFSYFPESSPLEVKTRIMRSIDFLEDLDGKNSVSGRLNAYSAFTEDFSVPHIFTLEPDAVHKGDQVSIFGDAFGDEQGAGFVTFSPQMDAEIVSWANEVIVCRVPDGANTGEITVTTAEGTSNGIEATVLEKFYDAALIENEFLNNGQARGWKADDQSWQYQLPFSFPFFGQEYDNVYVCSNGYLDFTQSACSYLNSVEAFTSRAIIAPLWDDLITNGISQQSEDIYIHSPSPDSVCFRWEGEHYETGNPVNVEALLYKDGRIKFNYGPGNAGISPTIGISYGDEKHYRIASHDGASSLDKAQTILFTPRKHSFTIPLDLGWNLISLPLKMDNNQTSQVLGSSSSGIESVWGYKDGEWKIHIPGSPEKSDLESIKTTYGYWVKTNQEGLSIQIQGELKSNPLLLTNGWNLVGFRSVYSVPVKEVLADTDMKVDCIWEYKEGVWRVYDTQSPGLSDLGEMEPGRGYWINIRKN